MADLSFDRSPYMRFLGLEDREVFGKVVVRPGS